MENRVSIFGDGDLSDFEPKPAVKKKPFPDLERVREVGEEHRFESRAKPPAAPETAKPEPRRYRTGRNVQKTIKMTPETVERFEAIADKNGWVLGLALEKLCDFYEKTHGKVNNKQILK